MIHIASMKKAWGMIPKILAGEKTIESRWYKTKRIPWDKIKIGETIYFKNSGELVTVKATATKVFQFSDLTPKNIREILKKFGREMGINESFYQIVKDKKYCVLVFLTNPKKVVPFEIDKTGFGAMTAWISVPNINSL